MHEPKQISLSEVYQELSRRQDKRKGYELPQGLVITFAAFYLFCNAFYTLKRKMFLNGEVSSENKIMKNIMNEVRNFRVEI